MTGVRRRRWLSLGVVVAAAAAGLAVAVLAGVVSPAATVPSTFSGPPLSVTEQPTDIPLVIVPTPVAPATGASQATTAAPATASSPPPSQTALAGAGVPADRIKIARLGIDLPIIEGDGVDAPIGKAAHYPGSGWPGGGTNIYIYGHARVGMFITLWQARIGDVIELHLTDGTNRRYKVTQIDPAVPWNAVSYLAPTPTEQLTLQTSTSYYPTAPRFVVIAVPAT